MDAGLQRKPVKLITLQDQILKTYPQRLKKVLSGQDVQFQFTIYEEKHLAVNTYAGEWLSRLDKLVGTVAA